MTSISPRPRKHNLNVILEHGKFFVFLDVNSRLIGEIPISFSRSFCLSGFFFGSAQRDVEKVLTKSEDAKAMSHKAKGFVV